LPYNLYGRHSVAKWRSGAKVSTGNRPGYPQHLCKECGYPLFRGI